MSCSDVFLGLIAILFPPIAVWIKCGLCSADSLINICLCMLGYVPGLLHAWYIIAKHPEPDHDYDVLDSAEGGQSQRVTYYYVSREGGNSTGRGNGSGRGQQQQTYGTTGAAAPRVPGNKPSAPQQQSGHAVTAGAGSSSPAGPSVGAGSDESGAPPSYSEVVRGDHKIQSQT